MRIYFTIALFLLITAVLAQVQEKIVSGRLTDSSGEPIPGVSIVIKGTTRGTTTDANGNYSISAPIGSILQISFVGMKTREILVTEGANVPAKGSKELRNTKKDAPSQSWVPFLLNDSTTNLPDGVAVLSSKSPVYSNRSGTFDPGSIVRIKEFRNRKGKVDRVVVKTSEDLRRRGFGMQFTTTFGVENIAQLPALQTRFSQGQSQGGLLQWRGADDKEIFSWGPLARTLEFDGSPYDYDRNGRLVTLGLGNGIKAKSYDTRKFFRTGIHSNNDVVITTIGPLDSYFKIDLSTKSRSGVIPNSSYQRYNVSTQFKDMKLSQIISADATLAYNRSQGNLMNRGANLASIMGSVSLTPPTFDNANGLSSKVASKNADAYELMDHSIRSFAPSRVDNPYGLVDNLPDRETGDRLLASFNLKRRDNVYDDVQYTFNWNSSFDKQWNQVTTGSKPGYTNFIKGRYSTRNADELLFTTAFSPGAEISFGSSQELDLFFSYAFNYNAKSVRRNDTFNFEQERWPEVAAADSVVLFSASPERSTHDAVAKIQYKQKGFIFSVSNRSYFSSTLASQDYVNFFPAAGLSIKLTELFYLGPIEDLKLIASASKSIREAPLVYGNWSHVSTLLSVQDYASFFESSEIIAPAKILPEVEQRYEIGLNSYFRNGTLEVTWYRNTTDNFLSPVQDQKRFVVKNVAQVRNQGASVLASFRDGTGGDFTFEFKLKWDKYTAEVKDIYLSEGLIRLSGFDEVASVIHKGKPVGAIYGTSWLRNERGQRVIDADGFPVENASLSMIGNPIPDWNMALDSYLNWRNFRLNFMLEYRKGGDVWNGTRAMLDYHGRSAQTAIERSESGFVYRGVTEDGSPNTTPVSFYDPAKAVSENRWVRYHQDGVGEAYIEDGSFLRLSELSLSFVKSPRTGRIRDYKISLIAQNVFQITRYSGVDPATSLFGYFTGNGMDLFNLPSTRAVSLKLMMKI